jgi:molybdopterin/thiamine biosynthesis adenylyltransferase
MNYDQVYLRNIGLFTPDQQRRLRSAKVTVAGVGGVGGIQAATLARMGIGELAIMDPGVFDAPDMNRQFAAMASTIGQNKAEATAPLLRDINPFLKLTVLAHAPERKSDLADLVRGSALVIDAIDYRGFDYKVLFAEVAREQGLYNFTAPIPDFGALLMIFDPKGMTLEEFYRAPADRALWPKHDIPLVEILGLRHANRNLADFASGKRPYISTNAGAAALAGALLATEAALLIAGIRAPSDLVTAPRVTFVDLLARTFEVFDTRRP